MEDPRAETGSANAGLRRFDRLGWGALLAAGCAVELLQFGRSYDDAYITYVFARSLAAGQGFSWHGTEVLGTSAPWLALLLAGLERIVPLGVPTWGAILSAGAGLGAAWALFLWGRRIGWPIAGWWSGLLWLLWPGRWGHGGGEWTLALAAVSWSGLALEGRRVVLFGAASALGACLRPEAALAPVALGLEKLLREPRDGFRFLAKATAVAGILTSGAWLLVAAVAGGVLPTTWAQKRAQAESVLGNWGQAGWAEPLLDAISWLAALATSVAAPFLLLALVGLGRILTGGAPRGGTALVFWGCSHLLLLGLLGLPGRYHWYRLPLEFALILASGVGLEWLWRAKERRRRIPAFTGACLALWVVGLGFREAWVHPRLEPRLAAAREVSEATARYPDDLRVAAYEVGYLGWFSSHPVGDLLGLVSPEVSPERVRAGRLDLALEELRAAFLVLRGDGGSLLGAVVPDPTAFVRDWKLERILSHPESPFYLFRRSELAARGQVERDLLADFARAGLPIRWSGPPGAESLAASLRSGGRFVLELEASPGEEELWFAGWSAGAGARLELRAEADGLDQSETRELLPEQWTVWERRLEGPSRATWLCHAPAGSSCEVAFPHLTSGPSSGTPRSESRASTKRKASGS